MKKFFYSVLFVFLTQFAFCLPSVQYLRSLKILPQTDIFFTQTENAYVIEIEDTEPSMVQMDLPELPSGTRFISSKKEEFVGKNGKKGTQITLWFTFSEAGISRIPPLFARINGRNYYFEFEQVSVYENPNLISPVLEINFDSGNEIVRDKKSGADTIFVRTGEKIVFTVSVRYGIQILDFSWKIPKDSIFTEVQRFDFASSKPRSSQFSTKSEMLSRFEWKILKEGTYQLPQIMVEAIAYNGSRKKLSVQKNFRIVVSKDSAKNFRGEPQASSDIFASAFEKPEGEEQISSEKHISLEEIKKMAAKEKHGFFDKLFFGEYAYFAGGEVNSVPEESMNGQIFAGGQKVKICEKTGKWLYIEGKEFSGWTKKDNIVEIK